MTARLRRRLLRRIAFLRRNRCSALLAGLLMFILVHPFVADSAIGATRASWMRSRFVITLLR